MTLFDAIIQALSLTKEGEDAFVKIGQALDSINHQQLASKSRLPVIRSQEQVNTNGSFCHVNNSTCSVSESIINDPSGAKVHNYSDKFDTELPSDLITSCVATLIMIQVISPELYSKHNEFFVILSTGGKFRIVHLTFVSAPCLSTTNKCL